MNKYKISQPKARRSLGQNFAYEAFKHYALARNEKTEIEKIPC